MSAYWELNMSGWFQWSERTAKSRRPFCIYMMQVAVYIMRSCRGEVLTLPFLHDTIEKT